MIIKLVGAINDLLWGDLIILEFSGGEVQFGLSLLVLILIPAGLYFTFKTKFLPFRLFPEMIRVTLEKDEAKKDENRANAIALALLRSVQHIYCHIAATELDAFVVGIVIQIHFIALDGAAGISGYGGAVNDFSVGGGDIEFAAHRDYLGIYGNAAPAGHAA